MSDIKYALRSLASHPAFTIVVIVTLALAIGLNTAIFSVLDGVLLRALPYDEPEQIVMLWESNREQGLEEVQVSGATYLDWRERSSTFDAIAAYRYHGYTLTEVGDPVRVASVDVSPALFSVLRAGAVLGRTFSASEEAPGNENLTILSHGSWTRRFGSNPGIINSSILLDGEPHTVIGVMPREFQFPAGDSDVEIWSPLTLDPEALLSRPHRMYNAIGRMTAGITLQQAASEMNTIAAQIAQENPESNEGWGVTLIPAHEQLVGAIETTLWVLFGAVTLVLLIGCANVANLVLVRSAESTRDFAVRATLGASAFSLVRRSMTESMILAVGGGLTGLLVAWGGVGVLRSIIPDTVPRINEIGLDSTVLGFTAFLAITSGLLFGLFPALRSLQPNLVRILNDTSRGTSLGRRGLRLSHLLVVSEVALALILLTGAGLMIRSFVRLANQDPGFRSDGIVSVVVSLSESRYQTSGQQREFYSDLSARVKQLPGVNEAGLVSALPMSALGTEFEIPFTVEGLEASSPSERPRADYRGVMPGYFRAMAIPLVQGRLMDEFDGGDGRAVALVNETLARRYFRGVDPLDQVVQMPMAGELQIVGVVGDVHHRGLQSEARPEVFVPFAQLPLREMHVVVHTDQEPTSIVRAVRAEILAIDPELPITATFTMNELLSASIAQQRFNMALLIGLAFCAVVIAAVGIYGVVSYSVTLRQQEIGVRMALGAVGADTVQMIVGQALRVVGVGVIVGLGGSVALTRLIASLLFDVSPIDPVTYISVSLGVVIVAAAAAAIPAMRAARLDPVAALRQ